MTSGVGIGVEHFNSFFRVIVVIALASPALHAQVVNSMFTGNGGDQNWSNAGNWEHDQPGLDAVPNNLEGMTFNVTVPQIVILSEDIEIDDLTFATGGAVSGGAELRVLGVVSCPVPTSAFIGGGGVLKAFSPIQVTSGLIIEDWTVETDVLNIGGGAAANPLVQLRGSAELNIFSTLQFLGDGQLTSANGFVPKVKFPTGGTITKVAAATPTSQSIVRANVEFMGSTTLSSQAGVLLFADVIGTTGEELELDAQTSVMTSGTGSVQFSCGLRPRAGGEPVITATAAEDTSVEFVDAVTQPGAIFELKSEGQGDVSISGNSQIDRLRMFGTQSSPLVYDGTGMIRDSANFDTFHWKSGALRMFQNRGADTRTVPGFGSRILTRFCINTGAVFRQFHTIRVGSVVFGGKPFIFNGDEGDWIMSGSCNLIGDITTAIFENEGTLTKTGGGLSVVDLTYKPTTPSSQTTSAILGLRQGKVAADDGEIRILGADLVFDPAERRLFRGSWSAFDFGIISIGNAGTIGIKSTEGARVFVEGENAMIRGLSMIEEVKGVFGVTGGATIDATNNDNGGNVAIEADPSELTPFEGNDPVELGDGEAILFNGGPPSRFICNRLDVNAYATVFDNGILQANDSVVLTDGVLRGGGGIVDTPLVHNARGIVTPGNPANSPIVGENDDTTGIMTITGDYQQDADGLLIFEIGGTTPNLHDVLAIDGAATVGGELIVIPTDGFIPQPGQSYLLMTATEMNGMFETIRGPGAFELDDEIGGLSVTYQASPPCGEIAPADLDYDCDVDLDDYALWRECVGGAGVDPNVFCARADYDNDFDVDLKDFGRLQLCFAGPDQLPNGHCE